MKFLIPLFLCFIALSKTLAQDIIKMEKSGGVYLIPCKVNGLPLKFIFDTGASDVSISLTEALFMLKNGYLKESDIKGTVYYSIANGEIAEGTKVNIQKIEVGKQTLLDVEASIVHSTEAPLLFGQSAMERFGKFTMDYSKLNLSINSNFNQDSTVNISNSNKNNLGLDIISLILTASKNIGNCNCKEEQMYDGTYEMDLFMFTYDPSNIYDVDMGRFVQAERYKIYDSKTIELQNGEKYNRVLFIMHNEPKKIKCKGCKTKYDFQLVDAIQSVLK
jgi:clan AA aspartic protease (TIGR02281 family)